MKPVKCSVAIVLRRGDDERFLAVRRPPDDDDLPDVWGLPAVTLQPGELPEAGVRRAAREKLGVEAAPVRFIGAEFAERTGYRLILLDIEAVLVSGEPDCAAAVTGGTRYVDQRWTSDVELLREGAERGSLCCRILLEHASALSGPPPSP